MFHYENPIVQQDMQELAERSVPYAELYHKTVLVTGANGMLATYVIYQLLYQNDHHHADIRVIALVRNEEKARDRFASFLNREDFILWVQDVCDPLPEIDKIHFIVHAAGGASPRYILGDPVGIIRANVVGTLNILEAARRLHCENVLYTSTREVYGTIATPLSEVHPSTREVNSTEATPSSEVHPSTRELNGTEAAPSSEVHPSTREVNGTVATPPSEVHPSTHEVNGTMAMPPSAALASIREEDCGVVDQLALRSCYPESKRMAESLLVSYAYQYQVPYTIVRLAHAYGPGMELNQDGRVMADFISDTVAGRNIVLKSDGSAERAFCYITDAVAGMFAAMLAKNRNETYNIANETEIVPIREAARLLTTLRPEIGQKVVFDIPKEKSAAYSRMGMSLLDTGKLEKLGWSCQIRLAEGLRRTVDSFIL